jgi:hypothetical protein
MRQKIYTTVAVLWCTVFPARMPSLEVVVASPDGTLPQAVAIFAAMIGLGIAAVLLDPKKTIDPLILSSCGTHTVSRISDSKAHSYFPSS